ncbi:MAG TPA: glucosamine-6-phosphate deaminase [Chryseolinea sp.]|nr:glucosamine-6-phosphate deaminase [Chryseolinea sp.]
MQLRICENYDALSAQAATEIIQLVKQKPDAVLCLASGDTPRLTYSMTAKMATDQSVDFKRCTFIGLDEWMGIPPDNEGSCHYFLQHHVFGPLNISNDHIHLFDGLSANHEEECRKMDKTISDLGGIDLMVVGIGMNGHIGFNEPAESFGQYSRVVDLGESTKLVGQKYFREQTSLTKGITLGLNHLLESKKAILVANGTKKADVMRKALKEKITPHLPASILRNHSNGLVILDRAAASMLNQER